MLRKIYDIALCLSVTKGQIRSPNLQGWVSCAIMTVGPTAQGRNRWHCKVTCKCVCCCAEVGDIAMWEQVWGQTPAKTKQKGMIVSFINVDTSKTAMCYLIIPGSSLPRILFVPLDPHQPTVWLLCLPCWFLAWTSRLLWQASASAAAAMSFRATSSPSVITSCLTLACFAAVRAASIAASPALHPKEAGRDFWRCKRLGLLPRGRMPGREMGGSEWECNKWGVSRCVCHCFLENEPFPGPSRSLSAVFRPFPDKPHVPP